MKTSYEEQAEVREGPRRVQCLGKERDGTCFEWGEEPDGALSEAKSDGEDSPNAEGVAENFFMAPRSEERPFEEWDLRLSLENKDDNEPKRLVFLSGCEFCSSDTFPFAYVRDSIRLQSRE